MSLSRRKLLRQTYYNVFSCFYDTFVRLHSRDKAQNLRKYLIKEAKVKPGMKVLDLCTGTGSVAIFTINAMGEEGLVVGCDFSFGMLRKAKEKSKSKNIAWVLADVTSLPFRDTSFDLVFCAYGFYELKDKEKIDALKEISRVLVPNGYFCMMEHEEPKNPFIKFLYRIRLATMGSLSSVKFIKKELDLISCFFKKVEKKVTPSGNSKLILAKDVRSLKKSIS